jgi:hypothetical protein
MGGATTDQAVQPSAQNRSAVSSITDAPAAQQSLSPQMNDQGVAPAPAATPAWPNPPTGVDKTQETTAPSSEVQAEAIQPTKDAKASNDLEGTAQASTSTTNTGVAASLTSITPVAIFPVAALGLVVAGFLLRIVVKIFVGPRRPSQVSNERLNDAPDTAPFQMDGTSKRVRGPFGVDPDKSEWIDAKRHQRKWHNDEQRHESPSIDPRESDWIDNHHQRGWRDDQHRHGSVGEGDELIDDLQSSLAAARSDSCPRPPLQDDSSNDGGGGLAASSDETREREEALEQLRRGLDRLLQS